MKTLLYIFLVFLFIACHTTKPTSGMNTNEKLANTTLSDTVKIENDSLEYQILIIEPGFNVWLETTARPPGYYSQTFLENRNIIMVNEWNARVTQPQRYDPRLYEMQIDYRAGIDYGYEVNYKLYNYFIYFQLTYNQRLGPFLPRI
jgi:hypothetical protein